MLFDFYINEKKKKSSTCLNFFDIEFDSMIIKTRFFEKKLQKIKNLMTIVFRLNHLFKRNFEKFVDFLIFCVKIIIFDRSFFTSLYKILNKNKYYCNITKFIRSNRFWWNEYLFQWNDIKFFHSMIFKFTTYTWIDVFDNWNIEIFFSFFQSIFRMKCSTNVSTSNNVLKTFKSKK